MLRKPAPSSSCPPVMVCGRGNDRNGRFSSELTRKNCNPAKPKRILWSCSKCATIGIMCPHRAKVSRHQHTLPTADQPGRSPSRRDNVSDKPTRPNMGRVGKSSLSGASETAGEPLRASVGAYFSGARTLRASEPVAGRDRDDDHVRERAAGRGVRDLRKLEAGFASSFNTARSQDARDSNVLSSFDRNAIFTGLWGRSFSRSATRPSAIADCPPRSAASVSVQTMTSRCAWLPPN